MSRAPRTARKPHGDAILQMEFDVARFTGTNSFQGFHYAGQKETPWSRIYNLAKTAVCDTIQNGGTFVLVVDTKTITMIQRSDAVDLDEPAAEQEAAV